MALTASASSAWQVVYGSHLHLLKGGPFRQTRHRAWNHVERWGDPKDYQGLILSTLAAQTLVGRPPNEAQ